jgi:DNA (cytosine-5)-methyltransferase 1
MLNHVALFAGMGGFIEGLDGFNIETSLANDIDSSCTNTVKATFPDVPVICASMTDSSWYELAAKSGQIDVLSAGFPCQPFSIAGRQDGFSDQSRGNLFFNILDFCESQKTPPKVIFLENVTNLVVKDNGAWLSQILEGLRRSGYWVSKSNCHIINSSKVSLTIQQRERLYIFAYHRSFFRRNYYKLPELPKGLSGTLSNFVDFKSKQADRLYLSENNKYYRLISEAAIKAKRQGLFQLRRTEVRAQGINKCPTLTANMGMGGHNVPFVFDNYGLRKLSVEECALLQGYNVESLTFPTDLRDSAKYKMIGNAVDPQVIKWLAEPMIKDLESL